MNKKKTEFLDPTFYLSIWQGKAYVNSWQILRDGILGHLKNRKGKNREKTNLPSPLECVGVNSIASSQKFSLSLMTTERGNIYPDFGLFFFLIFDVLDNLQIDLFFDIVK